MSENSKETQDRNTNHVNLEKRADILQASFEHYYIMAMDHHTKAATTSNLLLIIVGALIALVGHDNKLYNDVDILGGLGIFIIGVFGAIWVLKQHERYFFWQLIANEYHEDFARAKAEKEFGRISDKKWDRRLWIILHSIVAFIGICIAVFAACKFNC